MKILKSIFLILVAAIIAASSLQAGISVESKRSRTVLNMQKEMGEEIAIVNQDIGVENNENFRNYSASFIETLANQMDANFVLVSAQAAETGFENGTYAGVITFPSDFSERIVSLNTNSPKALSVEYTVNSDLPEIKYIDTYADIVNFEQLLSDAVIYMYVDSLYGELHAAQNEAKSILENDKKDLENAEKVVLGNYVAAIDFGNMPNEIPEMQQANIEEYLQNIQESGSAIAKAYESGYSKANNEYKELKENLLSIITTAGVEKIQDGTQTLNDAIKKVDKKDFSKPADEKTNEVCWIIPGSNLMNDNGKKDDWIITPTSKNGNERLLTADQKEIGAKAGELYLPDGGVMQSIENETEQILPPNTVVSPDGRVFFTVRISYKKQGNLRQIKEDDIIRIEQFANFEFPAEPRQKDFISGYSFDFAYINDEIFTYEDFEGNQLRKPIIPASKLQIAKKQWVVTCYYAGKDIESIRGYDKEQPENKKPAISDRDGWLLPGSNGKDENGEGDDWYIVPVNGEDIEKSYIAEEDDLANGIAKGDLVLPAGGSISKVDGTQKTLLAETVLKPNHPGQKADEWEPTDILFSDASTTVTPGEAGWSYVARPLIGEAKLTDKEMQDLMIEMMKKIDSYRPQDYFSSQIQTQAQREVSVISSSINEAQSAMSTAQSENLSALNKMQSENSQHMSELYENISKTHDLEQDKLEKVIKSFKAQKEETSKMNKEILEDFSEKLPYSRVGTMTNPDIVKFTSAPLEFVDISSRPDFTIDETSREELQKNLKIVIFSLLGLGALFLLIIFIIQRKRDKIRSLDD